MSLYGGSFTFEPINNKIVGLILCPENIRKELRNNAFVNNFNSIGKHIQLSRDEPFVLFTLMQFCDAIDKKLDDTFLDQLFYFINIDATKFSPAIFQAVYDKLSFSCVMNYKSFLQKISQDRYTQIVFKLIEKSTNKKQIKPFCRIDTSLKVIMRELTLDNWTLSKSFIGTDIIIANKNNLEIHKVHCNECPNIYHEFNKYIDELELPKHENYIMDKRHLYKKVDLKILRKIEHSMPLKLLNKINKMYIVTGGKKIYINNLTIICFCYKTDHIGTLNINLNIKCLYGNKKDLTFKYH